ncbi:Peptidase M20 like protein, partial [Aduncisulcus paluster]
MVGKVVVTSVKPAPEDEVVDLVSTLIRFDTSNTGELETTKGEAECARWIQQQLEEVGYTCEYVEAGAPGRGNLFARLPGANADRGALLIHGHLDVVPAEAADWSVHPFSGAVTDGYVWGRGAENGGKWGSQWLVDNRPDLFEGVTEAIGEVGGFSLTVPRKEGGERRLYLLETAEKGIAWMRLTAKARAGHGSMVHEDNAVTAVAEAVAKLGRHKFPLVLTEAVTQFLTAVAEETGYDFDADSPDLEGTVAKLGSIGKI